MDTGFTHAGLMGSCNVRGTSDLILAPPLTDRVAQSLGDLSCKTGMIRIKPPRVSVMATHSFYMQPL